MTFAEFTAILTKSVALNIGDSHRIATCKLFSFLCQLHAKNVVLNLLTSSVELIIRFGAMAW
jgi:hypothetical protein